MYPEPDHDPEEAARVRRVIVQGAAIKIEALRAAAPHGTYEYVFLRRDPATFNDVDFAVLTRLAWHYRRRLPRYLRPPVNPDDPIVRESATSDGR